jgi:hypothetical protein
MAYRREHWFVSSISEVRIMGNITMVIIEKAAVDSISEGMLVRK